MLTFKVFYRILPFVQLLIILGYSLAYLLVGKVGAITTQKSGHDIFGMKALVHCYCYYMSKCLI